MDGSVNRLGGGACIVRGTHLEINGISGVRALPEKGNNVVCVAVQDIEVADSVAVEEGLGNWSLVTRGSQIGGDRRESFGGGISTGRLFC